MYIGIAKKYILCAVAEQGKWKKQEDGNNMNKISAPTNYHTFKMSVI